MKVEKTIKVIFDSKEKQAINDFIKIIETIATMGDENMSPIADDILYNFNELESFLED